MNDGHKKGYCRRDSVQHRLKRYTIKYSLCDLPSAIIHLALVVYVFYPHGGMEGRFTNWERNIVGVLRTR